MGFFVDAAAAVFTFGLYSRCWGATLLGVLIGALPGLNPVMAIALLLPLTYSMDPLVALAMVAGIYNGSMYGGAIPAILLRIPGTPASIATTFDGFPMAEKGEASKALKVACWSSAIGGIASAVALMTVGPLLARVTLFFGPAEYFWIAMFGMASVGVMVGNDAVKGILAAVLGLLIGTMGIDSLSGQARFTFGQTWLLGGMDLIVVLVGLYALPPVLQLAEKCDLKGLTAAQLRLTAVPFAKGEIRKLIPTWARSSFIGIGVGILPGAGGNIAAFLSYNAAKNASDDPDSFGKGNPQGVAAAECGNNADNAASMIPALSLGIPGNVVAGPCPERVDHPRAATRTTAISSEPGARRRLHDRDALDVGPDPTCRRGDRNPPFCTDTTFTRCSPGPVYSDPDVCGRICYQRAARRSLGHAAGRGLRATSLKK